MRHYIAGIKRRLLLLSTFTLYYSRVIRLLSALAHRYGLVDSAAGRGFAGVRRRRANRFQILLYHRVNDRDDPFLPAMSSRLFRRQMEYLAESSTVWSLDDAVDAMLRGDLPDDVVVITFDDGYRDNFVTAFPILTSLSLTATVFLTTECIGSPRILWHDRVFRAFSNTSRTSLEAFGPQRKSYPMGSRRERNRTREELLGLLKKLKEDDRELWIDRLIETLAVDDPQEVPDLMMSWNEVREMHRAGMSFGSHTVSHPILSTLTADRMRDEIARSKAAIEQELGAPVTTFAYPNGRRGDYTERTTELLRQTGYRCAVTTIGGTNGADPDGGDPDLMELRRSVIWAESHHEFAAKMAFRKFTS